MLVLWPLAMQNVFKIRNDGRFSFRGAREVRDIDFHWLFFS